MGITQVGSDRGEERQGIEHPEVGPVVAVSGGFEWGTGFFFNPLAPEEVARLLRGEVEGAHDPKSAQ